MGVRNERHLQRRLHLDCAMVDVDTDDRWRRVLAGIEVGTTFNVVGHKS